MMKKLIQELSMAWFLIVALAGLAVWFGITNTRLDRVEADNQQQEIIIQQIPGLVVNVVNMKEDVSFIKEHMLLK